MYASFSFDRLHVLFFLSSFFLAFLLIQNSQCYAFLNFKRAHTDCLHMSEDVSSLFFHNKGLPCSLSHVFLLFSARFRVSGAAEKNEKTENDLHMKIWGIGEEK